MQRLIVASYILLMCGVGLVANIDFDAIKKKAADGDKESQYKAGLCYEYGTGANKNISKAIYCYNLASQNGHRKSKGKLALMNSRSYSAPSIEQHDKKAEQLAKPSTNKKRITPLT